MKPCIIIEKVTLIKAIKNILTSNNIAWGGSFGLKKNSISDMAYLCWENLKDEEEMKIIDKKYKGKGLRICSWTMIEDNIRYYGLNHLVSLAKA